MRIPRSASADARLVLRFERGTQHESHRQFISDVSRRRGSRRWRADDQRCQLHRSGRCHDAREFGLTTGGCPSSSEASPRTAEVPDPRDMAWPGYETSLFEPSGCSRLGRNFRARTLGAALGVVPGGIGKAPTQGSRWSLRAVNENLPHFSTLSHHRCSRLSQHD